MEINFLEGNFTEVVWELGGGFKHVQELSTLGEMIQFDFSNMGLKPLPYLLSLQFAPLH